MARTFGVPVRMGQIAIEELEGGLARGWADRDFRITMTMQEERAGVSARIPADALKKLLEE